MIFQRETGNTLWPHACLSKTSSAGSLAGLGQTVYLDALLRLLSIVIVYFWKMTPTDDVSKQFDMLIRAIGMSINTVLALWCFIFQDVLLKYTLFRVLWMYFIPSYFILMYFILAYCIWMYLLTFLVDCILVNFFFFKKPVLYTQTCSVNLWFINRKHQNLESWQRYLFLWSVPGNNFWRNILLTLLLSKIAAHYWHDRTRSK